jgi:hypothetical protein
MVCPICLDLRLEITLGAIIIASRKEVTIEKIILIESGAKIELNKE